MLPPTLYLVYLHPTSSVAVHVLRRAGEHSSRVPYHEPGSGRPVSDKVDVILEKEEQDRHISSKEIAEELKIDHNAVLTHLKKAGDTKRLDTWVRHELTKRNLMNRVLIYDSLLKCNETEPFFFKRLITGDENGLPTKRTCDKDHGQTHTAIRQFIVQYQQRTDSFVWRADVGTRAPARIRRRSRADVTSAYAPPPPEAVYPQRAYRFMRSPVDKGASRRLGDDASPSIQLNFLTAHEAFGCDPKRRIRFCSRKLRQS
ncbi:Histone-lysine N-methyltransferase SETMAR [Eumeta japonica]|uniref:Histone-lysine N-methyltransferase SETMAR n=1 Tax=Eumeta variegata TaxID=151549 RepID=A0A4C1U3Z9_EUMVA|nr:Histone-lysine N-methyltransferase SETMAR [Eumeta japonica]